MSEISKLYRIHGLVQGVGFRPFVAEQAVVYGVGGYVKNAGGGVLLSVKGTSEAVDSFVHRLLQLDGADPALPGAQVTAAEELDPGSADERPEGVGITSSDETFRIIESSDSDDALRILPPDIATCKRCERELFDRMNRRYRHPFISCVSCGPRFTIIKSVPYDRQRTSMRPFRICPDCRGEYNAAGDPRHYAQTICCKSCGPVVKGVSFLHMDGMASVERNKSASEVAIREAVSVLKKGGIIAIKNVGGYHFAHMADNAAAAKRLREAKAREEKPFAVMFFDIAQIISYAKVGVEEEMLLTSPARPIVLLKMRENAPIAPEVCGDSDRIGAMLPADPIQLLLLKEIGPLVMTSGNLCGEPILTEDEDVFALAKLGICDHVLYHDRTIEQGLDDSIFQVTKTAAGTRVQILRRARGYVPQPIFMGRTLKADTFAAGGDLKAVFALGRKEAAFLSGHFGDLIDVRAEEKRREAAGHMEGLLGITPERYVCDMHPKYVSAQPLREGKTQATVYSAMQLQQKKIQHHHAHILSVMAEHHLSERVLGVAYDGTGYGDDGTIWGGEFLLCDGVSYTRAGHLLSVAMAGGDIVAKDAYASAEAYLFAAEQAGYLKGEEHPFTGKAIMKYLSDRQPADGMPDAVLRFPESRTQEDALQEADLKEKIRQKELRRAALSRDMGVAASSSMGRLFDAAAVILGLGEANHFEGQLACRLQYAAQRYERRKLKGDGSAFLAEDAGGQSAPAFGADTQGPTVLPFPIKKEPTRGGCVYIADTLRLVASLVRERNAVLREMAFAFPSDEEKAQDTRNGTAKDDTRKAQMFSERMDELAFAFHEAIACMTATMCDIICGDEVPVALSGGTFANGLILRLLLPKLAAKGYTVYMNEKVPCGDGGLALGQLYAATFEGGCLCGHRMIAEQDQSFCSDRGEEGCDERP